MQRIGGDETLERLIGDIYDAAMSDGSLWRRVLEGVLEISGARTGWVFATGADGAAANIASIGMPPEAVSAYPARYAQLDPWYQAARRLPPGTVFINHEHVDPCDFDRTEIYADYVLPHFGDTTWCLGGFLPLTGTGLATFGLQRLRPDGAFTSQEAGRLRQLVPHLHRALMLRTRIGVLQAERDRALGALSWLGQAVIVLDAAGRALLVSRYAEEILDLRDGLCWASGALRGATAASSELLARAIAAARKLPSARGTMLRVTRPSGKPSWVVLTVPFQNEASGGSTGSVLIVIGDPEQPLSITERDLVSAFGLTPAEARVAIDLAHGLRPEEIATRNGVAMPTVRTQVSAILAKTGTEKQVHLSRLLMSLPNVKHP